MQGSLQLPHVPGKWDNCVFSNCPLKCWINGQLPGCLKFQHNIGRIDNFALSNHPELCWKIGQTATLSDLPAFWRKIGQEFCPRFHYFRANLDSCQAVLTSCKFVEDGTTACCPNISIFFSNPGQLSKLSNFPTYWRKIVQESCPRFQYF